MQFCWCHIHRDMGESLEGRGMQRIQHRALDRLVHQLVPLIVYDLMRRGVWQGTTALSIVMRGRSLLPGGTRVFLILERPVKTSGDRWHVVCADRRACDAVTAVGKKKNSIKDECLTGEKLKLPSSKIIPVLSSIKNNVFWSKISMNFEY